MCLPPLHRFSVLKRLRASRLGFTLSELLIALAILGVIATFTIPKVLTSMEAGSSNAKAHEAMQIISEAIVKLQQDKTTIDGVTIGDLTKYINYAEDVPAGVQIDEYPNKSFAPYTLTCQSGIGATSVKCIRLHNGAILAFYWTFSSTPGTSAPIWFDPDGKLTTVPATNADSSGKGIQLLVVSTTRRVTTWGRLSGATNSDPSYYKP